MAHSFKEDRFELKQKRRADTLKHLGLAIDKRTMDLADATTSKEKTTAQEKIRFLIYVYKRTSENLNRDAENDPQKIAA